MAQALELGSGLKSSSTRRGGGETGGWYGISLKYSSLKRLFIPKIRLPGKKNENFESVHHVLSNGKCIFREVLGLSDALVASVPIHGSISASVYGKREFCRDLERV